MEIRLDGCSYEFVSCYQEEPGLRESFCELAQELLGLDFGNWYRAGHWNGRYRPYSLTHEGKVVANVSVSPMDMELAGKKVRALSISTVMCRPGYRGRGLVQVLMNHVLHEWSGKCDIIYLYANADTLEFFPRFGFRKVREYRHTMPVEPAGGRARRLIPELSKDKQILQHGYAWSNPFALLRWEHDPDQVFFRCMGDQRGNAYYIKDMEAVAVAEYDGEVLYCHDVFCPAGQDLAKVLGALARPETTKAVLGFTPRAGSRCSVRPLMDREHTLFVLGEDDGGLRHYQCRVPVLARI